MTAVLAEHRTRAEESWALVQRAQSGDQTAIAEIWMRYEREIYAIVYARVGNRYLAEDITSDVMVRAIKRLDAFVWTGKDLGAWLATVACNLVVDYYRSGRYRLERLSDDPYSSTVSPDKPRSDVHWGAPGAMETDTPESLTLDYLDRLTVLTTLAELPDSQREVLTLRYLQGLSIAETAQRLAIATGTVKSHVTRACVSMRQRLMEAGFER